MKFDIVVWDWDNTLLDSRMAAELALKELAAENGLPQPTEADIINVIGSRRGEYWLKNYPDDVLKSLHRYLDLYVAHAKDEVSLFPETKKVLEFVQARHIPQLIASNKDQYIIDEEVDRFGLKGYFEKIVGGHGVTVAKPSKAFADLVLGKEWPKRILMIGDGESDMNFAQTMGAYALFMRSGKDKMAFPYDKRVQNLGEVFDFLKENL
ncbi:MAG: HAD family hydrolase [Alphaproteobacteria bacterium]|nr:HAD family hydrolase [Alphaproteobacteria bacterium]